MADIEDLPPCAKNAVARVQKRGGHPEDNERELLFSLLAFRISKSSLAEFAASLNIDKKGETKENALSRTKKSTPWCSNIIGRMNLCPYTCHADREENCFQYMPKGTKFSSPAFILGVKRKKPTTEAVNTASNASLFKEWDDMEVAGDD